MHRFQKKSKEVAYLEMLFYIAIHHIIHIVR